MYLKFQVKKKNKLLKTAFANNDILSNAHIKVSENVKLTLNYKWVLTQF